MDVCAVGILCGVGWEGQGIFEVITWYNVNEYKAPW